MGGCGAREVVEVVERAPMYPDYGDTTVPVNIAPLNFLLRGDYDAMDVVAQYGDNRLSADCKANEATFPLKGWHKLLPQAAGDTIRIDITARKSGTWMKFPTVKVAISPDSIDAYLTYRLIEPDYEIFSRLQICQRNIENYDEQAISDYRHVGNRCMNCHTFAQNNPDLTFLYLRGPGGGMVINRAGELEKINLKTDSMPSGPVYAQISPSGKYLVFSTNVIIPGFHSKPSKRLEVFDTQSDIYIANLHDKSIITSPLLSSPDMLETFPTFSPDGKSIYYCLAHNIGKSLQIDSLQYSICRIDFDEATANIGEKCDTIVLATAGTKTSTCHPRVSPDGNFLLYTVADYGTFPIWHTESDQQMMHIPTGRIIDMDIANSPRSDTYHSWSSNSRWIVFASKRDDGLYGKPYFAHIDADGRVSRPFVLPQKYPSHYDNMLKSYNVPELGRGPVPFTSADLGKLID